MAYGVGILTGRVTYNLDPQYNIPISLVESGLSVRSLPSGHFIIFSPTGTFTVRAALPAAMGGNYDTESVEITEAGVTSISIDKIVAKTNKVFYSTAKRSIPIGSMTDGWVLYNNDKWTCLAANTVFEIGITLAEAAILRRVRLWTDSLASWRACRSYLYFMSSSDGKNWTNQGKPKSFSESVSASGISAIEVLTKDFVSTSAIYWKLIPLPMWPKYFSDMPRMGSLSEVEANY